MRIDFHSNVADTLNYSFRLIRKAYAANSKITVYHNDTVFLQELDQALWSWGHTDFLAHVSLPHRLAAETPILLSNDHRQACPHRAVLLNLSEQILPYYEDYQRLIEIISPLESARQAGRQRYRNYQQTGHELTHIVAA